MSTSAVAQIKMVCPHCSKPLFGTPEQFLDICMCPACGQSGYFVKAAPDAASVLRRPSPQPAPCRHSDAIPAASRNCSRSAAAVFGALALCALLAGGIWNAHFQKEAADEAVAAALKERTQMQVASALALPDLGERLKRLQELQKNCEIEKSDIRELIAQALLTTLVQHNQELAQKTAAQAQQLTEAAKRANHAETATLAAQEMLRVREEEMSAREERMQKLIARESAVAAAEKRLAEREETLQNTQADLKKRMQALEESTAAWTAENNKRKEELSKSERLWEQIKLDNEKAQREAASAVAAKAKAAEVQPLIIVREPAAAPSSSTVIIRDGYYSSGWPLQVYPIFRPRPPRPFPHFRPCPRPRPCPVPGPRPRPHPRPRR